MRNFNVLVTGVSRGLGYELFDLLIESEIKPVGICRRFSDRHLRMATIDQCGVLTCDLSDLESLDRLDLDGALKNTSYPILLINNAASVTPIGPVQIVSSTNLARAFNINVVAPAVLASKALRAADSRGVGLKILNVTSGAAKRPIAGLSAYCSSKAAAEVLLDCLKLERADVDITHVDPGAIDTGMQDQLRDADVEMLPARGEFLRYQAQGRLRPAREVAREILVSVGLI
jgi:NAD(P)-dependent dehydrogenase (short-subunit alcohol dehydrogenase family)